MRRFFLAIVNILLFFAFLPLSKCAFSERVESLLRFHFRNDSWIIKRSSYCDRGEINRMPQFCFSMDENKSASCICLKTRNINKTVQFNQLLLECLGSQLQRLEGSVCVCVGGGGGGGPSASNRPCSM